MSFIEDPEFTQPTYNYMPQAGTLQYTTFVKRCFVEALQDGFAASASKIIQDTKVAVQFSQDKYTLPAIVITFNERSNVNVGVGHEEWYPSPYDPDPDNPTTFIKYYHRIYKGDIGFDIYAKSSTDLGRVRDTLVEILTTTDATVWGNAFIQRLYFYFNQTPYGGGNAIVLNTDQLNGSGETTAPLPWNPEDKLAYKASYRMGIFGQYLSAIPSPPYSGTVLVEEVDLTVYRETADGVTIDSDFYVFTGYPDSD